MAKPTGFLEFARDTGAERPYQERLRDWQPIHLRLPEARLHTQAARCMDCGIPFCHKGQILQGATTGCPLHNLIPEWNDLVYRGLWREAYDRLSKTNNFPEFTGLVCPAPCEAACTLGITTPPVTIKNIEYAIMERAFAEGWVRVEAPPRSTGKRVAIVGSGPAGLACADQLHRVGHRVTVFERADRVGGLLMYGIPNMKLDKQLVQRRIAAMAAAGVVFVPNTEVGRDVPVAQLRQEFEAVVLCIGATRPRDLPVPGREFLGIHFAVDYLQGNTWELLAQGAGTRGGADSRVAAPISAAGKDVVVIGGGDTGTDCVASALRQGCRSVTQLEILPAPPPTRAVDNPWPQWPKVYRLDYGQAEATAVLGQDPRHFSRLTRRFVGDEAGGVQAVETVAVAWVGQGNGRFVPQELPDSTQTWSAQLILLAMGFLGPETGLLEQLGVAVDGRSCVQAPDSHYMTNQPGIFAAGDARRGQSLVVWAIQEGRAAAREVDRWLMGHTDLP